MFGKRSSAGSALAAFIIYSIVSTGLAVYPQDLVASEEIGAGGSSVFVFRESRKKPQIKAAAGGGVAVRSARGGGSRKRIDSAFLASKRKRASGTRSGPATGSKGRIPPANAKLKVSESLAARGDSEMQAGQIDQAIASYREAFKNNPRNTGASSGLSDALTAKGIDAAGETNSQAGVAYLQEAVTLDPKNDVAYAKLGEIFAAGDQTERGILNYEKALAINAGLTEIYVPLGLAYLKTGNIAKAEAYSTKAQAAGTATADGEYLRGMLLYKQNKNPEALAAFQKTLSLDPNYSSASYYEAAVYDRLNQGDQSIAMYKKTVAADPEYSPAWFDLGVAYYNAGDYNNAAMAYQQAIKYDPNNGQAHSNLASTYRQLERYPDANAEYKQAEALGIKKDPDLYSEWGYCLGKTDEWSKSELRLIAARELSDTAIDNSNVGWAYNNAASEAKAKNDDAAAKTDYELSKAFLQKAVEKDPKLDAAYLNLGSTYNGLGEFALAVSVLNVAINLHRDWVLAINQLGVGYRGIGDLNSAISQFQRATTLDGNNIFGLFSLGSAQYASGDKKGAKRTQDRLSKLNPALANQLGNIIAGKVINEAEKQVRKSIPIRIPY